MALNSVIETVNAINGHVEPDFDHPGTFKYIIDIGNCVAINVTNGGVEFKNGFKPDAAALEFYTCVQNEFQIRIAEEANRRNKALLEMTDALTKELAKAKEANKVLKEEVAAKKKLISMSRFAGIED